MAANRKAGLVFRRAPLWYKLIGWACFATGGWVLWMNVKLTLIGLATFGVPMVYAQPLGYAMAAIESAVSIFATQPENWDDIWAIVSGPVNSHSLPKVAKIALASVILGTLFFILGGVYYFDFVTTLQGAFPANPVMETKTVIIVLAFIFGTEVCSFFGFQAMRMAKIAKLEALEESMSIEPHKVYAEELLGHRNRLAKMQAQYQIEQEMQHFYSSTGQQPAARNGKGV